VNIAAKLWTVPGLRMKAGREHRVPPSDAGMAVLLSVRPDTIEAGTVVFPSPSRAGSPLSDMTLTARRSYRARLPKHISGLVRAMTSYPREIADEALAHALRDKVEAAYRRGDALEKWRELKL
jgi:integrase